MRTRRKLSTASKTKVVLEALSERYTMQELVRKHEIHPNQISQWKSHFLANAHHVFEGDTGEGQKQEEVEKEKLYEIIGQQKVGIDFFFKSLVMSQGTRQRRSDVERSCSVLRMTRQCELLEIHRSGLYYQPRGESELDLEMMRPMDEQLMLRPW